MNESALENAFRLHRAGRLHEAAQLYGEILRRDPKHFAALHALGMARYQSGQLQEAERLMGQAVALNPAFVPGWHSRGGVLEAMGRPAEALLSYERVLRLDPMNAEALGKRAGLLLMLNRAAEAAAAYDAYLKLKPGDAQAWTHKGIAASEIKRLDEALTCFTRAVALAPQDADFRNNKANALFELGRFEEAAAEYEKALSLAPDIPYTDGFLIQCRLRCCDWRHLGQDKKKLAGGLRAGRQVMDPLGSLIASESPAEQLQCARIWIAGGYPPVQPPLARSVYRHKKIRIAYLSADYRPHPVAHLIAGVFESHDRDRFETMAVSLGPPSPSEIRSRIEKGCDRIIDVREKSDAETAQMLRGLESDIVIDLMGFTDGCRTGIFSYRPAPVQVNYLGYPGTMGAPYMDYMIADRIIVPEAEHVHYSERVVYLPNSYQANDSKRRIAERTPSRAEAGLPEQGFVFCSFNNNFKIGPEMFAIWMRLLQKVEGSVLWLLHDNAGAARNLQREANARGIAPERLIFAARKALDEHLARHRLADLFLDTLPYNAHTTASDALWTGLPVVTCTGSTFAGRVANSLLRAAGLPELVTHSRIEYESLALKLAQDRQALQAVKAKLGGNRESCPLFDTARTTRALESAYTRMWEMAERGETPRSFAVTDEGAIA